MRRPVIILIVSAIACALSIGLMLAFDPEGAQMLRSVGVSAVFYLILLLGLFLGLRIRSAANRALHTQELLVVICIGIVAATLLPHFFGHAYQLLAWVLFNWTALVGFYVLYAWKIAHDSAMELKKSQATTTDDYSIARLSPRFWPAQAEDSARKWGYESVLSAAKRLNAASAHAANDGSASQPVDYGFLSRSNGAIASVNSKRVFFESTKGDVDHASSNAADADAERPISDILFFDNAILLSNGLTTFESDASHQAQKQIEARSAQEKAESVRIFGLRCNPTATWLVPYADIDRAEKSGRTVRLTLKNGDAIAVDAKAIRSSSPTALAKTDAATALMTFLAANADINQLSQQSVSA